jgi:hypothetical protein
MTNTTARWTRLTAGAYTRHGWHAQRINSDYGDIQWVVDAPGRPAWGQFDTLAEAKRAVDAETVVR